MQVKKFFVLAFILAAHIAVVAQNVQISGTVYETIDGKNMPLPFANVIQAGTTNGTSTDFDGKFTLKIPKGETEVLISSVGFVSQKVVVNTAESKKLEVVMKTNAELMQEFEVTGRKNMESEAMLLMERKEGDGIKQQIGAEELSKTGSSTVAAGLTKVAGLSVVGSNSVFVRGLGDRYNSAYMNGLPIASPDPDRRVAPLNIFSSSVVRNISVDKAYLPSLYGDFSGGAIDIRTKDYFESPTFKVSLSGGVNTSVMGRDFLTYDGGKLDRWGFEDGSRSIPSGIVNDPKYQSTEGMSANQKFNYNLDPAKKSLPLNTGFKLYGGSYRKVGKEQKGGMGYLLLASHNNSANFQDGKFRLVNRQEDVKLDYDISKNNLNTRSAVLGSFFFEPNKKHEFQYNVLFVNMSMDQVQETDGFHFDYQKRIYTRRYTFRQHNLLVNQIHGKHELPIEGLKLRWDASINTARSQEPDRRQFVYLYDIGAAQDEYVFNAIDRLDNHRFFSDLTEDEMATNVALDYDIIPAEEGSEIPLLKAELGFQTRTKEREFDYRQFIYDLSRIDDNFATVDYTTPSAYLNDETHEQDAFDVSEVANPASAYSVSLSQMSGYTNVSYGGDRAFGAVVGVRVEDATQFILYRDQTQPTIQRKNLISNVNVLPSVGLKYSFAEETALRLNMSQTISRPGFKEVAPFEWTEVFSGIKIVGNPTLENGTNYNADLRYEVYPNPGELLSATAFYKRLDNPIERSNLATASGRLQSFRNADGANVAGLELEANKKLNFIGTDSSLWSKMTVGANFAYIYSKITLGTNNTGGTSAIETNPERPLQGASPFLANVNVSLSEYLEGRDEQKYTVTLSYNIFGRRLFAAGIQGMGDMYELPAGKLNLVGSVDVTKTLKFGLSASNLLNPTFNTIQETSTGSGDILTNSFKRGISIGFNLTYKIL